ncbi:N-acylneuraminate cytidylyltransferase/CMP-N,N'-diacetyllegionaminic acid synthase [Salegentibacter echinorum]|uniref:N-acylneuraminate cytidylyltransferase/CMP-N,N'-diacetyllegionaminic acid synthase n=1 Tax=Salegentibacter echinorum TaxID=1073325 RepID=A0A1M5FHR2_SALEC|nr:acylneuraminate cytidylyltransferase family protein [Salegentibacter echinorum]SHF91053.1 N-acylneuraminate cytidylyltransferase/CMP-N,N'-diacetyllegionaminic acid synthase [Salegentibacter echinorum]
MDNILITVCARGGSKGIPDKNIKEIGGEPLIYYTLRLAKEFKKKHPGTLIYLSTDSNKIKEVVETLNISGVNTNYTRPQKLADDSSGKLEVINDLKNYVEAEKKIQFDYIMDMDVTSPLRTLRDLEIAFEKLIKSNEALNIFSVSPAARNPYFNMVEVNDQGFAVLCKQGDFLTRQSAPAVYDMNASFYIFKEKYFENGTIAGLMEKALIYEVPHVCFDLDHPIDFDFMTFMIENNKLNFEFLK